MSFYRTESDWHTQEVSTRQEEGSGGRVGSLPGTRLGDLESGPTKVLFKPLVVFKKTSELELGHGLSASAAGTHCGRRCCCEDVVREIQQRDDRA